MAMGKKEELKKHIKAVQPKKIPSKNRIDLTPRKIKFPASKPLRNQ